MQNLEDSLDPITAMNKALALMAKAFKFNTIPTNNNQRSSLIPHNSQIAQPNINTSQDIKMKMVDDNIGNQVRQNAMQNDGNKVGQNAVQNSSIQNVENMNGLSQASTSGTQSNNAPVYDSDGSTEVPKDENCYDHDIFNMLTHEMQYTDLQTELDPYNDMQQKIKRFQAHLGDLKTKIMIPPMCNQIPVTRLSQKLKDENVSFEFQVSEQKGTTKGTRMNTMFIKQSILGKPPSSSSSYKPKLYSVTPFPKSSVLPKVDKTNALSKPVTSNSAPSIRESKVVQTVNVIALRILILLTSALKDQTMDMKSAFLYGTIEEEVYVSQPPSSEDPQFLDKVYKVEKALYGLHQAPKAWYETLSTYLLENGFRRGTIDMESLFIKKEIGDVPVQQKEDGIFISQDKFQVTPKTSHLNVVKRIFRYLKGQPKLGLWYPRDSPFDLEAFSNSDYAGASLDRKSTIGGCQFLGKRLISRQCKKQTIVANSTTEAEYVAATNCYGQAKHIEYLVGDEVVHKELGDRMERDATTASS
ncbi:putative ribonuclease H-like domain-containing protein [Tanacetum coccineum]